MLILPRQKGREVMEKYLQKYKDIDVVVSQNDDMTFGAIEAISCGRKRRPGREAILR